MKALTGAAATILRTRTYEHAGFWAEENRILSRSESSEPGPFNIWRAPYFVPIYAVLESGKYKRVVIVCGSQMSKTEFTLNRIGYRLDTNPVPILLVLPNKDLAKRYSKNRVAKMLKNTKSLWDKQAKGRLDNIFEKYIAGTPLRLAWATSASQLCSDPFGEAHLDELDRMNEDVEGEGSPVELTEARGATYPDFIQVINSTPTLENVSPIMIEFDQGTRQVFHWCCPDCGHWFVPWFKTLWWPEGESAGGAIESARVICPECETKIGDEHRNSLNDGGKYLGPGQKVVDGEVIGDLPETEVASFRILGLCSPWKSFGERAAAYIDASNSGNIEKVKTVINTGFGETFKMKGEAPKWNEVRALCFGYKSGELPEKTKLLTMAADVHKDNLYYAIRAWGPRGESWTVEVGIVYGDTEQDKVWDLLEEIREMSRQVGDKQFIIRMTGVDFRYRPHRVWNYTNKHAACIPLLGIAKQSVPIRASSTEVKLKNKKKNVKNPLAKIFNFDDFYFKSEVHSKVRRGNYSGPGSWHLPDDISDEYCRQIVAEELVTTSAEEQKWVKTYKHNHWLDCEKMNEVLGQMLKVSKFREGKNGKQGVKVLHKGYTA